MGKTNGILSYGIHNFGWNVLLKLNFWEVRCKEWSQKASVN